ncbi:MAG: hypothetical protein ABI538_00275 [Pseudoxanthomonas sp.]
MEKPDTSPAVSSGLQELVGYAIPVAFASIAPLLDTQAEAFLALALMATIVCLRPEWDFLNRNRVGLKWVHGLPTLVTTAWLLLIGFGALR